MMDRDRLQRLQRRATRAAKAVGRTAARLEDDRRVQVGFGLLIGIAAIAAIIHSPGAAADGLLNSVPVGGGRRNDDDDDRDEPPDDPLIVEME